MEQSGARSATTLGLNLFQDTVLTISFDFEQGSTNMRKVEKEWLQYSTDARGTRSNTSIRHRLIHDLTTGTATIRFRLP